jgi:hypothetical protein
LPTGGWRLVIVFAIVAIPVIGLSWTLGGGELAFAATLSALACFTGAVSGHFLAIYPRGNAYLLARLYASMAARLGFPFVLLFVCKVRFENLFSQGMVYFVILFYLVGLLVDLTIRMRSLRANRESGKPAFVASTAKVDG